MKIVIFVALLSLTANAKCVSASSWDGRHWGLPDGLSTIRGGSDNVLEEEKVKESKDDNPRYQFSLYQPGDGHEADPDGIPPRFLSMQKGNREAAKASVESTLKWRQEYAVDTILARAHVTYDLCKAITPHSFLGRDATGHIVFFQRPALDASRHMKMVKRHNLSNEDLILHYVYVLEYCWNLLDPPTPTDAAPHNPDNWAVMTSIVDLTGLDMSILRRTELIGFVQQFVTMMSTHYPQRSYKTLVVNAPAWFGMLYKLIAPMLRESTKEKVEILTQGPQQVEVLREVLGEECLKYLPPELLETDKKKYRRLLKANRHQPLPTTPMENELREFCRARLVEAGLEMKSI